MRTGEIIAVGSELLLGGRLDTNSLFLSDELATLGVELRFKSAVGDDERDIVTALRVAVSRAKVVVLTGGLGPTDDDCTREAVAQLTKKPLRRHKEALESLRRRLKIWGRTLSTPQLRQARVPVGADVLPNHVGSAPGFCLMWRGCFVAALPGVPAEAEHMFRTELVPRLKAQVDGKCGRIERRVLHSFGLPEAEVDQALQSVMRRGEDLQYGLLASPLGVSIVLSAYSASDARRGTARLQALDRLERAVRERLARWIYAEGDTTMEQVVGRELAGQGLSLAVAESCTGGLIGHRLTEVPGSSRYLDRVVVSYSNRAKEETLGVPKELIDTHGAVSAEVASAMARGIRARSETDVGLSVTGITGPDGGSDRKPVGLVYIGLDARRPVGDQRVHHAVQEHRFHGNRQAIKLRASQAALNLLRQWLLVRPRTQQPAGR
jgi:nicotinamide-nucleotide amidase